MRYILTLRFLTSSLYAYLASIPAAKIEQK